MYFSLCEEDKILNEKYFKGKQNGIYMEIGAANGIEQSNTKFFEDTLDWTGILVEPNIDIFQKLKENRPNNKLFNNIISDQKKEYTFQFLSNIDLVGGITETLPKQHLDFWYGEYKNKYNQSIQSFQMKAIFLTDVIKQTDFTHIDFFSLDVEGHEFEILNSWDFSIPIYLILLETLDRDEEECSVSKKCKDLLESKGYKDCGKLAHNTVFILQGCYLDE